MGLIKVAPGELATIVTTLEMTTRPLPRPLPEAPLQLTRWDQPDSERYRTLFRRIGEPWLWFSRLHMDDRQLIEIIRDPAVSVHAAVDRRGIEMGMLELDFREAGACEISYFGLVPELAGKGIGRWLMGHALALGWREGVGRLWVHTCTLDHPSALGFYRRQGFRPIARTIETFADPRLLGLIPREAAPQIPLIDAVSRR